MIVKPSLVRSPTFDLIFDGVHFPVVPSLERGREKKKDTTQSTKIRRFLTRRESARAYRATTNIPQK